ncbi:MAG: S8 family serine peptidase [Candidatus Hodarchaeota archaeon]
MRKILNSKVVRVLILFTLFLYVPLIFSNYLINTLDVKNDDIIEDDTLDNNKNLKFQEYSSTSLEDKIESSLYNVSSMNIREDNRIEFVIQRESSEFTVETIEFFKKYDIEIHEENSFFNSSIVYISLNLITDSIENFALDASSIPGIAYAEPNFYDKVDFTPNDPLYSSQWAPQLINMESAWDSQLGSSTVRVAIIDSGIDYTHTDLSANYLPIGYDFVNNDNDPMDDNGHGTHCAGIVAAIINNGIGVVGMAGVSVFAEKSLDYSGGGSHEDFRDACYHAVDNGADIISYSGGGTDSATKQAGVDYAIANGVMFVAAAGNDGSSTEFYPAAYPAVIGVTATDINDNFASFSNYGTWIDVAAPGVDIHSTYPGDSYYTASGTSMATPHLSGLAALIKSEYPAYTSAQIEALIYENAVDLGTPGFDIYFGNGRIDATTIFMDRDYDLGVSLEIPPDPEIGNTYLINATVTNLGINTETFVELYLYLDEAEINSATFSSLLPSAEGTIDFVWTPMEYRTYNFTVYAPPVTGEVYLQNNMVTELITISTLRNYTMTTGYPYTWIDATAGTELVLDDDDSSAQALPFNFEFYDTTYSTIYLSSNGYLSFADSMPEEYSNDPIPSSDPENTYLITPFWDDLDPSFSGSIYVNTDYSTYWVAEWLNIYHFDETEVGTFEIILYNTGEIIFSYYEILYHDGYTCGLNYGDMLHYNSYQGLDTSTSLFSIHFALEPIGPTEPDLTDRGGSYSSFTPTSVEPDVTSFNVWCDVENIGTEASGEFNITYYASLDTTITDSDYLIGIDTLSSIVSGDYADSSWSGTFPGGIPDGTYYIGWIIDSNDYVDESDENNNIFYETSYTLLVSSLVAKPDLTDRGSSYSDFTPNTVEAGVTSFNVWCDVENIGTEASGEFNITYYASLDTTITDSDYLIGIDTLSSIVSGDYADSSWSGTFPGGIPDGTYYIGWIIDSNDYVDESDENNNIFYETSYTLLIGSINTFFQEDFEGDLSNWVDINGLWHLTDTGSSWPDPCHSLTHSMWFGDEVSGTYNTGSSELGNITSIPFDLSSASEAYLEFYHWKEVEQSSAYDVSYVYISTDGFTWDEIYFSYMNVEPWNLESINISAYCGNSSVQIRFYFNSFDEEFNNYRGWLVDDIQIVPVSSQMPPSPIIIPSEGKGGGGGNDDEDEEDMVSQFMIAAALIGAAVTLPFLIVMIVKKRGKLPERDITPPTLPATPPKSPGEPPPSQTISKLSQIPQFCPKCGVTLKTGGKFCTRCGAKIIK